MIFDFLKKQKNIKDKKITISLMIKKLSISEKQKSLYLQALEIIDEQWLETMYKTITDFMTQLEEEKLKEIRKDNFSYIAGMNKKEAKEKQEEINTFNFLINNL